MKELEEWLKEVERKVKEELRKDAEVLKYLEKLRKKSEPCLLCREDRG